MFLGRCHKMTPRQVGSSVTLTPMEVCGVKPSWSALCEHTKTLVQVTSSAIRALLPLHVSCWAAGPPRSMSPGLPKSPAPTCSSSAVASRRDGHGSSRCGCSDQSETTVGLIAVGSAKGGEGRHCGFSCRPRLDLQWGETRE